MQGTPSDADHVAATFGLVVRALRLERGLSQERLAEMADVHRTYVSMVERGVNAPSLPTVFALARALGLDPEDLVGRTREALTSEPPTPSRRETRRRRARSGDT